MMRLSGRPLKSPVPFIPDADVGADDLSAQRRRRFCRMQKFAAVEGHGQVGVDGTHGNFAGRADHAGKQLMEAINAAPVGDAPN